MFPKNFGPLQSFFIRVRVKARVSRKIRVRVKARVSRKIRVKVKARVSRKIRARVKVRVNYFNIFLTLKALDSK